MEAGHHSEWKLINTFINMGKHIS